MKNAKKFVKIYEDDIKQVKGGYFVPPRSWEDVHLMEKEVHSKYLQKEDAVIKTELYLDLLDDTEYFGFYLAFKAEDFSLLNNVLFQTSRHELLRHATSATGTDHSIQLENVLTALSCNDFEVIDAFFPKNLPLSKGQFYNEVSVNLLKILYFNEPEKLPEALQKAEKFLSKKIDNWEKNMVLYFLALTEKDAKKASEHLQALCVSYQRITISQVSSYNKLEKTFAKPIHGVYRFAKVVGEDFFQSLVQPEHACFWKEFEAWQKEHNYPKGKLFYQYSKELDYMNKILQAKLPSVKLHKPYPNKKDIYRDEEQFAKDLTENVLKL